MSSRFGIEFPNLLREKHLYIGLTRIMQQVFVIREGNATYLPQTGKKRLHSNFCLLSE
ncbi:MAG: hypothetical protein ACI9FN_002001 [Saprospiraceae bacterium]|jgi:hypothetical protein